MFIAIWVCIFVVALYALLKGADLFLVGAEAIGKGLGFSPFAIGMIIVGLGTSLPELFSSLVAVFTGQTEFVIGNAVGSNIANILLVVGISAFIAKTLTAKKNLIELDLPLLLISTSIFIFVAYDGSVTFAESLFLLACFIVYLFFMIREPKEFPDDQKSTVPYGRWPTVKDTFIIFVGLALLLLGATYLIESVTKLSLIVGLSTAALAATVVAFGTSLPELAVSLKAIRSGKSDVALGNIFGSNIFNLLVVVGVPGLFGTIMVSSDMITTGLPVLAAVTVLFIVSSASRRVYVWEGAMYVLFYVLFVGKILYIF
jgi:cation:H+ antiporter